MADMTQNIGRHLIWLEQVKRRAQRTVTERRIILQRAERELPDGLDRADEGQLAAWLHPHKGWTLVTYDSALRVYYGWGVHYGILGLDPMVDIARPGPGPRIPHPCSDDELATALTAPRWPWRRAVMLAAYAGLRCAELCAATTADIVGRHLVVHGKGGHYRTVPIGPELNEELDATRPGPLLVGGRGVALDPRILTQMQRPAWAALGLPDTFSLHSCRHWFATSLTEAGVALDVIRDLLGHATVEMTQAYLQVTSGRKSRAVEHLPRLGRSEPGSSRLGPPQAA